MVLFSKSRGTELELKRKLESDDHLNRIISYSKKMIRDGVRSRHYEDMYPEELKGLGIVYFNCRLGHDSEECFVDVAFGSGIHNFGLLIYGDSNKPNETAFAYINKWAVGVYFYDDIR
jgi:hypothetical protein